MQTDPSTKTETKKEESGRYYSDAPPVRCDSCGEVYPATISARPGTPHVINTRAPNPKRFGPREITVQRKCGGKFAVSR